MAKRMILKEGDPALNRKARPVTRFDARLKTLVDDMLETMYDGEGVGLAAPQVGVLRRLFVMDVDDDNGAMVFVNPDIKDVKGEQEGMEGCLSIPDLYGVVKRPMEVLVSAQDEDGKPFEVRLTGLGARCVCHECDHLDGILFRRRSETPLISLDELTKLLDEEKKEVTSEDLSDAKGKEPQKNAAELTGEALDDVAGTQDEGKKQSI
ncbi:MAG: peptide deformylase [Clostridiaceae bacterium]|nr:peptide deformylase [Clostridiaceae bacterium]